MSDTNRRGVLLMAVMVCAASLVGAQEPGRNEGKKRVRATLIEPEREEAAEPAARDADAAEDEVEPESRAAPAAEADETPAEEEAIDRPTAPVEGADRLPVVEGLVNVIEVQLDAIVERRGEIVTGLGPEDFLVKEEGRPVEVTSAIFYGSPRELEASGEGAATRADRYFILFFHDRSLDAPFLRPILLDAGQQARRWVDREKLPNDQVAVMAYDVRLKVQLDFSRDPQQIRDAISRAVTGKKEPQRWAGRSREPLRPAAGSPSLLLNLPAGRDLARGTTVFEKTLTLLGRAAEGIVGRKNLMLFSVGFGEVNPSGVWQPDVRYQPELERSLNHANVAVYAIDLVGSRRTGPSGPGIASSLSSLAGDTAGVYYESFTNFLTPMREVSADTEGYYLISFRSEHDRGATGYRKVEVETRDPELEVRARRGYLYGQTARAAGEGDR